MSTPDERAELTVPGPAGPPAADRATRGDAPERMPVAVLPSPRSGGARIRTWMRKNPLSVAGAAIVLALVAMALLAPYLPLLNPIRMNVPKRFSPPGA
ncbi:MAG TPA: hypothetical protein VHO73_09955, partial [Methylomirabilota bacterium]|nr:hypothetical protein [Methylomirabilota bacterium]